MGYGAGDGQNYNVPADDKTNNRHGDAAPIYNTDGSVRILGVGSLTDDQKKSLSEAERGKLQQTVKSPTRITFGRMSAGRHGYGSFVHFARNRVHSSP
jgi:hypothetical protein